MDIKFWKIIICQWENPGFQWPFPISGCWFGTFFTKEVPTAEPLSGKYRKLLWMRAFKYGIPQCHGVLICFLHFLAICFFSQKCRSVTKSPSICGCVPSKTSCFASKTRVSTLQNQCFHGWWLEHFSFFHILGIIIPIDEVIFLRGVQTTNQSMFSW